MPDYTLKHIPEELCRRIESSTEEEFRSINQEILARLQSSFDAQEAKMTPLHARWVHEALASGVSTPLKTGDVRAAFKRGVRKARARKPPKAA